MSNYTTVQTNELLPNELAASLGLTADAMDQFDLMRAIQEADKLVAQIRATQLIHTQNLCRIANRLKAGYDS